MKSVKNFTLFGANEYPLDLVYPHFGLLSIRQLAVGFLRDRPFLMEGHDND